MLVLMASAKMVLTDSGGLPKECILRHSLCYLGKRGKAHYSQTRDKYDSAAGTDAEINIACADDKAALRIVRRH